MENRLFLKPDCNKFTQEYMSWKWIIQLLSKEHENMIEYFLLNRVVKCYLNTVDKYYSFLLSFCFLKIPVE